MHPSIRRWTNVAYVSRHIRHAHTRYAKPAASERAIASRTRKDTQIYQITVHAEQRRRSCKSVMRALFTPNCIQTDESRIVSSHKHIAAFRTCGRIRFLFLVRTCAVTSRTKHEEKNRTSRKMHSRPTVPYKRTTTHSAHNQNDRKV